MNASRASSIRTGVQTHAALERVFREHVGFALGAVTNVITTTISFLIAPYAQLAHLMIIHLIGAVLISTRYGMVVSTFTAVTGALAFDYFCIPPVFAFALPDPHSVLIFAGMMAVALLVCWLNQGVRQQRAAARASEARTNELCELSLDLSRVTTIGELAARANTHLGELFDSEVCFVAGSTSTVSAQHEFQVPVGDGERIFGHLSLEGRSGRGAGAAERRLLLAACADRMADAFKRLELGEATRRAQVDAELERNRNALLSAVSHDMKTPLASILTASTSLLSAKGEREGSPARELLETIVQEADRMNGLITNLLSVTRLEAGTAALSKELEALDDLISGVLGRLSGRLAERALVVDIPQALPLVPLDAGLVDQVITNLLENALRYTPSGSPIEVRVTVKEGIITVDVADRGPGIGVDEREKVFGKFYRGQAAKRNDGGTGLGLTICRAVARAHDGEMSILPREGGGTLVRLTLPCPVRDEYAVHGEAIIDRYLQPALEI